MIQEIINNIIKHAGASEISFDAIQKENQVVINIKDNGKGFDISALSKGSGIQNLQSRSKMIAAEINFISQPGSGTLVSILINTKTDE